MKYIVLPKKNNVYGYCVGCAGAGQCNAECTLCREQNNGGGGGGGCSCHSVPIYAYRGGGGGGRCDLHSC